MNLLGNLESRMGGHQQKEIILDNGVHKEIDRFGITFIKREVIDGLKYRFSLSCRAGDKKKWHLRFSTEDHGLLITNKGLAVYREIINNIIILVNTARSNESVEEISFFGADEELRVDEIEEFKNLLKTKLENGKNVFDNFSYISDRDGIKKSIHINNGYVLMEWSGEKKRNLKQRIKNEPGEQWHRIERKPLLDFVEDSHDLEVFLEDKEVLSDLMKHIGADFSLGRNIGSRDSSKLRTDLYERTLKQRFPEYRFQRDGSEIKLFLK